jgi:uncharacterized protein
MDEKTKSYIIGIVREVFPALDVEIIAFGSRIRGDFKEYSDLDLVLKASGPLELGKMASLREKFEESRLVYKVDLQDFHNLGPDFQKRVIREGVIWNSDYSDG